MISRSWRIEATSISVGDDKALSGRTAQTNHAASTHRVRTRIGIGNFTPLALLQHHTTELSYIDTTSK
jgi:hypothetical protein